MVAREIFSCFAFMADYGDQFSLDWLFKQTCISLKISSVADALSGNLFSLTSGHRLAKLAITLCKYLFFGGKCLFVSVKGKNTEK